MPIPENFRGRLSLPAIVAPMFLVSGVELIAACRKAGLAGAFPVPSARSSIHDLPAVEELVRRMREEYRQALAAPSGARELPA